MPDWIGGLGSVLIGGAALTVARGQAKAEKLRHTEEAQNLALAAFQAAESVVRAVQNVADLVEQKGGRFPRVRFEPLLTSQTAHLDAVINRPGLPAVWGSILSEARVLLGFVGAGYDDWTGAANETAILKDARQEYLRLLRSHADDLMEAAKKTLRDA